MFEIDMATSSHTATSGKVQKRINRTRQNVLNVSAQLFVDKGFEHVTVEDIIEQAQIARSSFYRFFANKMDVLSQILRPIFATGIELLEQIDCASGREIMSRIILIYPALWERHGIGLLLSIRLGEQHFHLVEDLHNQYVMAMSQLIETAQQQNILRNDNARQTTLIIAKCAITIFQIYQSDDTAAEKYLHSMRGMLLASE